MLLEIVIEIILNIIRYSSNFILYYEYSNQDYKFYNGVSLNYSYLFEYNKSNLFSFPKYNFSETPKGYNKCKLCSFVPNNGSHLPNSSGRDAIFLLGINKLTNLLPIVKTLRTTGSKCRVFLFTDAQTIKKYGLVRNFYVPLENCGLEIVNLGDLNTNDYYYICYLRYNIYKSFLILYRQFFDRIIFMDLYDSIIQHDPFTTEFGDSLYLSNEGYIMRGDDFNMKCTLEGLRNLKKFHFSYLQRKAIFDGYIINGGLQEGTALNLIKLCSIMEESGDVEKKTVFSLDQSFLNIIVYSGLLSKIVNFTILPKGNELSSTIGLYVQEMIRNRVPIVFGKISRDGKIPAILHQFDRHYLIRSALINVCPNDENFIDYIKYD